jgi:hypothetical protein
MIVPCRVGDSERRDILEDLYGCVDAEANAAPREACILSASLLSEGLLPYKLGSWLPFESEYGIIAYLDTQYQTDSYILMG